MLRLWQCGPKINRREAAFDAARRRGCGHLKAVPGTRGAYRAVAAARESRIPDFAPFGPRVTRSTTSTERYSSSRAR